MLSQSITVQVPSVCGGTITSSTRPPESQTNTRLIASPLVGLNWDDCWDELKGLLGAEMWVKRRLIQCEKGPMSADAVAVLIRQKHIVGTDGDEPGVTDFYLVMKLDQTLGLAPILRAESSPAKH